MKHEKAFNKVGVQGGAAAIPDKESSWKKALGGMSNFRCF